MRTSYCDTVELAFIVVVVLCHFLKTASGTTEILTDFEKPEDLRDVVGSPYILVSESSLERDVPGRLSLLDTRDNSRVPLTPTTSVTNSPFADPSCTPATTIAPHGIDIFLELGGSTWQVAVVNHYSYESIEFYVLDPSVPSLAAAGCTRNMGLGDIHNAVSYLDDRGTVPAGLAVTLWFNRYYGLLGRVAFIWSFFNPFPNTGTGALKLVGTGGSATEVLDKLNGANGLLYVDASTIYVAETSDRSLLEVNPQTSTVEDVLFRSSLPDNLVQNEENSLLMTRIDSPFIQVSICDLTGLLCKLKFTVFEYDWENDSRTDIYSGSYTPDH